MFLFAEKFLTTIAANNEKSQKMDAGKARASCPQQIVGPPWDQPFVDKRRDPPRPLPIGILPDPKPGPFGDLPHH